MLKKVWSNNRALKQEVNQEQKRIRQEFLKAKDEHKVQAARVKKEFSKI
ncbi:hypothetical protein [Latilactobacillus curvatus]